VSGSPDTPPRMPSGAERADLTSSPGDRRWRIPGLVLVAVWGALFAVAVLLWVRVAFLPADGEDVHGYIRLLGAPFALVALALVWWAWRSARALRRGRREGWTILLVLGGVAVAQTVMTAPGVVAASAGPGTPGVGDPSGGPPRDLVTGMLVAIGLGLASLAVGVLGRRGRGPARDEAEGADPGRGSSVSDPG
jgi:membrane protease YdiL (CAAX protease family)